MVFRPVSMVLAKALGLDQLRQFISFSNQHVVKTIDGDIFVAFAEIVDGQLQFTNDKYESEHDLSDVDELFEIIECPK